MLFSIIIPVYNVEDYLDACLESVVNQSFSDWEAICVDDGSTDGSSAILERYINKEKRIRVLKQANGGLSAARNAGMAAAKGDYVLFLDSDDWLENNALEVLNGELNGEDLLCFSGRRFIEEKNVFHSPDRLAKKKHEKGIDYYNENALVSRDFAFVCVVLRAYRRLFLEQYALRFKEGVFHEDNLFTPLVCYYAGHVKQISNCLYDYRVRKGSIMTAQSLRNRESIVLIANELSNFFIKIDGFDKTTLYRALTQYYQMAFVGNASEEDRQLLRLIDWKAYRNVSRTKLRHRLQYFAMRISPKVFRMINGVG